MKGDKMNSLYKKKVLITGGGGMIGRSLVKLLLKKNAKVTITDLKCESNYY
jgi:NAD(P)-dependent dehydrogenase (short-subunit alcohol dehydrogenase family)